MANSTRFGIPLPDVGASTDTWGDQLNAAFSSLEQKITDRTAGDSINGPLTVTGRVDVSGPQQSNIVALAANTIDLSLGNYFTRTINANTTFTFTNPPSGKAFGFVLELNHTSGTVAWPASVVWPNNIAPTLTTARVHLFVFITDDTGTKYRGASLLNYAS